MPLSVDDYLALPRIPADHRTAYADAPACFGDLYLPRSTPPHPVAIVLHGGCWRTRFDLAPMSGLAAALARAGFAAWNLEYRRLEDGGGWPTTFLDAAAGADHLRALAGRFALDLTRVVALGHSAGGTLALWLAGRARLPAGSALAVGEPLALRGVIALAAIADLADGVRRGLCGGACAELMGGTPLAAPQRYREGSPAALAPLRAPHAHVVGDADALVPAAHVAAAARAMAARAPARVRVLAGAGHFEPVVPMGPCWDVVLAETRAAAGH